MKKAILTIDIGTSSLKAALFDETLNMIASKSYVRTASKGFDADEEWKNVLYVTRLLIEHNPGFDIISVAITSILAWVLLDGDGRPLAKTLLYTEQIGEDYVKHVERMDTQDFCYKTGRRPNLEMLALKIKEIKDKEPEIYGRTASIVTLKDYFNYLLTGKLCTDYTFAGYYMMFNIRTRQWDEDIIKDLGLDIDKLPPLKSSVEAVGYVKTQASADILIPSGIPVAVGGPDGSTGIIGAGGFKPGYAISIMGTTDVCFASCAETFTGHPSLIQNIHPLPGHMLVGGPMGYSGGTVAWLAATMGKEYTLDVLNERALKVEPGSEGVMFVTGLTGERTPFWNSKIRGSIAGLCPQHGVQHIFRAALEANAYTTRRIIELMEQSGIKIKGLVATGGGTASSLWMQIKADITGLPVYVKDEKEATLRGCAMVAGIASGMQTEHTKLKNRKIFYPSKDNYGKYQTCYRNYLEYVKMLSEFYNAR